LSEDRKAHLAGTWGPFASVSEDVRWALVGYWTGTDGVDLWVADLDKWFRTGEVNLRPMVMGEQGRPGSMHFTGDRLLMETQVGAPNGRVVEVDLFSPHMSNWRDVVPASEDLVISGVSFARGIMAVNYLDKAKSRI